MHVLNNAKPGKYMIKVLLSYRSFANFEAARQLNMWHAQGCVKTGAVDWGGVVGGSPDPGGRGGGP